MPSTRSPTPPLPLGGHPFRSRLKFIRCRSFIRGAGSKSMFLHRLELGVLVFSPGLHRQERTPVNLQT